MVSFDLGMFSEMACRYACWVATQVWETSGLKKAVCMEKGSATKVMVGMSCCDSLRMAVVE